jgi:hypothetical protein
MSWTTPEHLRLQVQKLWDRGRLLACMITPRDFFPLRLSLCKPDSTALSERFEAARAWSIELQRHAGTAAPGYRLVMRESRHRIIGTNALPHEVWIDTLDQALRFIGRESEAAAFEAMVSETRERSPQLLPWLEKQSLNALALRESWSQLLGFVAWMQARHRPSIYIRQVDLPGMDSKFVESHRPVLARLLDLSLPAEAIDGRFTGKSGFARRYGFRSKPTRIRLRRLDDADDDTTLSAAAFARLDPAASCVFMTENEINFLSFPALPGSLVLFGAGYAFEVLGRAQWLQRKQIIYWGDIDTHGFAILDQLRTVFPRVESVMMDHETLLAHRPQWVTEGQPVYRVLEHLRPQEAKLYDDLRHDVYGYHVRLEQERIGFGWVTRALADVGRGDVKGTSSVGHR